MVDEVFSSAGFWQTLAVHGVPGGSEIVRVLEVQPGCGGERRICVRGDLQIVHMSELRFHYFFLPHSHRERLAWI